MVSVGPAQKTEDDQGRKVTSPGYFDFSCGFPTRVCKVGMLGADIEDARGVFKLSPELVLSRGVWHSKASITS